jgi:hypothetical protein
MLKSKFSLSRHFEYANEQITYHFWLCPGRVKPKTIKLVFVASPLSTHHSGERGKSLVGSESG